MRNEKVYGTFEAGQWPLNKAITRINDDSNNGSWERKYV